MSLNWLSRAVLFAAAGIVMVTAAELGDDFSNDLITDLAPILSLFGERVTTQFMSQALTWADSFILAVAPLGIITIIVSAIRVGGPKWLKAVIGRAMENRAAAEVELMSSTSNEVCELWNGLKIVRVAGDAPTLEYICLLPKKTQKVVDDASNETINLGSDTSPNPTTPNAAEPLSQDHHTETSTETSASQAPSQRSLYSSKTGDKPLSSSVASGKPPKSPSSSPACDPSSQRSASDSMGVDVEGDSLPHSRRSSTDSEDSNSGSGGSRQTSLEGNKTADLREPSENELHLPPGDSSGKSGDILNGSFKIMDLNHAIEEGLILVDDSKPSFKVGLLSWESLKNTYRQKIPPRLRRHPNNLSDMESNKIPIQATMAQSQETRKKHEQAKIVIIRNNDGSAPNVFLNVGEFSSPLELWLSAIFGSLLQLGVLVYTGFATYHPHLMFEKEDELIEAYAYPCTTIGTIFLVLGLAICAHVVELSTEETYHRPRQDMEARMVWLQRRAVVNDQAFGSYAIFSKKAKSTIITSCRADESTLVWRTCIGTSIAIIGYLVQFVGLRGMHWSATVVQLAATIIMTGIRALVRRDLTMDITALSIPPNFELDWFASKLVLRFFSGPSPDAPSDKGDENPTPKQPLAEKLGTNARETIRLWAECAPWRRKEDPRDGPCWLLPNLRASDPLTSRGNDASKLSKTWATSQKQQSEADEAKQWIVKVMGPEGPYSQLATSQALCSPSPGSQLPSQQHLSAQTPTLYRTAQMGMALRKGLADIANVQPRLAAAEARAAKLAIENTMASLDSQFQLHKADSDRSILAQGHVDWHIESPKGRITLSVRRRPNKKWETSESEIEATLSMWRFGAQYRSFLPTKGLASEVKTSNQFDEDSLSGHTLRLLGTNCARLRRDLAWWMPGGVTTILTVRNIGKTAPHDGHGEQTDEECAGIIGYGSSSCPPGWQEKIRYERKELSRPYETTTSYEHPDIFLAMESDKPPKFLLAQHIFTAFMVAVAKKLPRPLTDSATIQNADQRKASDSTNGEASWKSFVLHNANLSKIAQGIETTGLGSLEEGYLCIIPPLSHTFHLPMVDIVVHQTREHAERYWRAGQWDNAAEVFTWLFRSFPDNDPLREKVTAILATFLLCLSAEAALEQRMHISSSFNRGIPRNLKRELEREFQDDADPRIVSKVLGAYAKYGPDWISTAARAVNISGVNPKSRVTDYPRCFRPVLEGRTYWASQDGVQEGSVNIKDRQSRTVLHYACQKNSFFLKNFLETGTDLNTADYLGWTPMHMACAGRGHEENIIYKLVRARADVNKQTLDGMTPLHFAARVGAEELVGALLNVGADPNVVDRVQYTALHWAAFKGHLKIVQLLLPKTAQDRFYKGGGTRTVLHLAAMGGNLEIVEAVLIKRPEELTMEDAEGLVPFYLSVKNGHMGASLFLLKKLSTNAEWDPEAHHIGSVNYAALSGSSILAEKLLDETGVNIDKRSFEGSLLLHYAASGNCADLVDRLVRCRPDMLEALDDRNLKTPLQCAAENGSLQAMEVLLAAGADPLSATSGYPPPLHLAAGDGHENCVRLLLNQTPGPPVSSQDRLKRSPLHMASSGGHEGVARCLLDHGASLDDVDHWECTPLHSSADSGDRKMAELLIKSDPNQNRKRVNAADYNGRQPLAYAALACNVPMIRLFLDKGAEIDHKDNNGNTALTWLAFATLEIGQTEWGRLQTMRFLIRKGANVNFKNGDFGESVADRFPGEFGW